MIDTLPRPAAAGAPRPISRRPSRLAGPALLLAAMIAPAFSQTAGDETRLASLSVSVRPVEDRCFTDRLEVTGVLAPRQQVDVGVDREGLKATQILVRPLDRVAAGQVLARLAPTDGPETAASALRAPVAGIVLRAQGSAGQPVSSRQGPLFQLVVGADLDLVADVPLADLRRIRTGQDVTVRPLGLQDVAGRVRRIEPGTEAVTQVGQVRIGIDTNPDVRVGTFARGVVVAGRRCGLSVPYSALQYAMDGLIVQVVNGNRIETRQVTMGLLDGAEAEILSGLSKDDMVVSRAGPFVREGDVVEPIADQRSKR